MAASGYVAKPVEKGKHPVKPAPHKRFPVDAAYALMKEVLSEKLKARPDYNTEMGRELAEEIKKRLKGLDLPRFKILVKVVVGENRGEGIRIGSRYFWDETTDAMATESFVNDKVFACATAYAVYLPYEKNEYT